METFPMPEPDVFDTLSPEQWFYIRQFIVNRRFSAEKLAHNLECSRDEVVDIVRGLMRAGILIQKFEGIYAIRPGLDLYLADHLQKKKRL